MPGGDRGPGSTAVRILRRRGLRCQIAAHRMLRWRNDLKKGIACGRVNAMPCSTLRTPHVVATCPKPLRCALFCLLSMLANVPAAPADDKAEDGLPQARKLLLGGHYAEAEEAYAALAEMAPVEASVGVAQSQISTGRQ